MWIDESRQSKAHTSSPEHRGRCERRGGAARYRWGAGEAGWPQGRRIAETDPRPDAGAERATVEPRDQARAFRMGRSFGSLPFNEGTDARAASDQEEGSRNPDPA